MIDCQLLREVYINLLDQKEPKLDLQSPEIINTKLKNNFINKKNIKRKVIKINDDELELHNNFLKSSLQKNFFN